MDSQFRIRIAGDHMLIAIESKLRHGRYDDIRRVVDGYLGLIMYLEGQKYLGPQLSESFMRPDCLSDKAKPLRQAFS